PEIDVVLTPAAFVSTLQTTAPISNTGTPSSPNIALTGLIPSQNLSGTYSINIAGNATSATNASMLGGLLPNQFAQLGAGNNTFSGTVTATNFIGSGAGLTNISMGALPSSLVYNNQNNTFLAGFKQTFTASGTYAGLNIAGVSTDPTNLGIGDLWFNTNAGRL